MKALLLAVAMPALAVAAAAPTPEDLARCAAISANDARLACFDALSHAASTGAARPAPAAPTAPVAPQAPQAPVAAKAPVAPVAPTAPAAANAPASSFDPGDPKNFGFVTPAQRHIPETGPKKQTGRIVSFVGNQPGHATIVLDNGQTWAVLDDDGWLSDGQDVIIKRASLGSFLLYSPSHHSYRVHRLQ